MLFNSFEFIFLFLPVVFVLYFLFHRLKLSLWAFLLLLLASLVFYGYWNPIYLWLITGSMVFNYGMGIWINKTKVAVIRKLILTLGVIGNVTLLGYYKYYDFFIENINFVFSSSLHLQHLALPLAISFFTFQQIAFLVDTYRGETKQYSFFTYALFVSFFPQLIAGPIVHHKELIPQFMDRTKYSIQVENIARGIFIFSLGLFKKVVVADTFAIYANEGYARVDELSQLEAWMTSGAYTLQLYFDFSAYGDMAIGIALLFNIVLPINFFSPYKARNIQDFWKTWHMTLNRFLTQYVYFPLGGSRKGESRTYINILLIFFISGFWHGAGWTFIIWGMLHGLASVVARLWSKVRIQLPYVVSWAITMFFVHIAWVYFRAESVSEAHLMLKKMFTKTTEISEQPIDYLGQWNTFTLWELPVFTDPGFAFGIFAIALIAAFLLPNTIQMLERFRPGAIQLFLVTGSIAMVLAMTYLLHKTSEFLYFNF